jgi:5-dehydro-2-deoxygluconokinase
MGMATDLRVFAFDHRMQLEQMASYTPAKGAEFKQLCLRAALQVQDGRDGYGILCCDRIGKSALDAAQGTGLWVGRPCEWPASRPLTLEPALGPDCGGLASWAKAHVVKVLCFCHPNDDAAMWDSQIATVAGLYHAARAQGLEFLLEVIPSKVGPVDDTTTAKVISRFYDAGIRPDWWKLEPLTTHQAWQNAITAIQAHDTNTRGIVVLGLDTPEDQLAASFAIASAYPLVRGFAVGRTIFGAVARAWLDGELAASDAVAEMARRYARLCAIWDQARAQATS